MEKINAELELKLEKSDEKSESLKKELANASENNKEIKKGSEKVLNENKHLKTEIGNLEKQLKEEKDSVEVLENTLSNKVSENTKLNEELDQLTKAQFHCIFCEFKFETDEDLKKHVRSLHDEKCGRCDLAFKDKQKLKDHICKLNVRNPSQGNCYMKNWVLALGCTQIINKATMEEVAILHCEDCWRKLSPCSDLKPLDRQHNSVFHGKRGTFLRNGVINWSELMPALN